MKQYTWKTKEDDTWDNDNFATQEECFKDAIEQGHKPGDVLLIGEAQKVNIDGEYFCGVLEEVETDMSFRMGDIADDWNISSACGEYAERWPIYSKYSEKLNKLIRNYLKEIGEESNFFNVINIREVTIKERRQKDD